MYLRLRQEDTQSKKVSLGYIIRPLQKNKSNKKKLRGMKQEQASKHQHISSLLTTIIINS